MKLRCRFCKAHLTLNPDCEEARATRTDPRQQLRHHIAVHHFLASAKVARHAGWLIDLLCFEPLEDPEAWRRALVSTLDWLIEEASRLPPDQV
jgi:hypothetical protein